jgi:hypothetical protein
MSKLFPIIIAMQSQREMCNIRLQTHIVTRAHNLTDEKANSTPIAPNNVHANLNTKQNLAIPPQNQPMFTQTIPIAMQIQTTPETPKMRNPTDQQSRFPFFPVPAVLSKVASFQCPSVRTEREALGAL